MKRVRLPLSLSNGVRPRCSNRSHLLRPYAQTPSRSLATARELPQWRMEPRNEEPTDEEEGRKPYQDEDAPFFARLIPKSRAYFTSEPEFIDNFLMIEELGRKYSHLPKEELTKARRVKWLINTTGKNRLVIDILRELNKLHPAVMPKDVKRVLEEYRVNIDEGENRPKLALVDSIGRGRGAGRRKSSSAEAWAVEGTGEILVNGKTLVDAFGRIHDRESIIWPLKATNRIDKYNIWALASGGGTTGQAEALQLAIAKALVVHEPPLKTALRRAGVMTRDPRRVERKKPNHLKARKKPAWVKR